MGSPKSSGSSGLNLFPFILEESTPSSKFESAGVYDPVGIPTLLNLFPLTPGVESSTRQRDSTQSLGPETPQTFLRVSGIDAVTRRQRERLLSQSDHHDPTLPLFKCPDSGYVRREESPVQMSMMRDIQEDLPMLTSGALSTGQSQVIGHGQVSPPSRNAPLQDPYVTSSKAKGVDKGKGKMVEADGGLNNFGPNYIDLSKWKSMMLAPGNSNGPGSGYASSSMAATLDYPSRAANINQSQHLIGVPCLDADGVGTSVPRKSRKPRKHSNAGGKAVARHGPQPKSSPFRGVTHYKRTDRWEAHIWHQGKQLYLGASATAEQAARAYDRAAIHFRRLNAQLNYTWNHYTRELRQLVEVSDSKLLEILRKQSFGEGTLYPDYPPREH